MRRLYTLKILGLILIALFASCSEVPPIIDHSEPVLLATDTTYISAEVPRGTLKNVLIEDISGVQCNNCPKVADIAHQIKEDEGEGRVVVMTLHSKKFGIFTNPFSDSQDTFNTDEATQIVDNFVGNINGLPAGSIDRKVFEGNTQVNIPAY